MAIQSIGGGTAVDSTGASRTITINKPLGLADDDHLFVLIAVDSAAANVIDSWTIPSNWFETAANNDAEADSQHLATFMKYVVDAASEPSTYTFSWTGTPSGDIAATIDIFRNVETAVIDTVDVASPRPPNAALSNAITFPSVATTQAGDALICVMSQDRDGTIAFASPQTKLRQASSANATLGLRVTAALGFEIVGSAGATGTRSATSTQSRQWRAMTIALREYTGEVRYLGIDEIPMAGASVVAESDYQFIQTQAQPEVIPMQREQLGTSPLFERTPMMTTALVMGFSEILSSAVADVVPMQTSHLVNAVEIPYATITVVGRFVYPDGTFPQGSITLTPVVSRAVTEGIVYDDIPVTVQLSSGTFSAEVLYDPGGYQYSESFTGYSEVLAVPPNGVYDIVRGLDPVGIPDPLPLPTITITGEYRTRLDAPAEGSVSFVPDVQRQRINDHLLLANGVSAPLVSGAFDLDIAAQPGNYLVTESISGEVQQETLTIPGDANINMANA